MAALHTPARTSKCVAISQDAFSQVFRPKDALEQPCDVILVVKDGKEFKAHRQVLSEASPFFEKLLNTDMKESKEGIIQLEMFSEYVMGNTLEFIYTGRVQILTEDNARDLIVAADYLLLQNLKSLTEGVLLQKLDTSNCFSTYYISQRYQCKELFLKTKNFILANFINLYAGNRKKVLNMSGEQLQMWISSDEINVTAEEDVFKIILAWIDHDRRKRKKHFAVLFRHVRLAYLSRHFLCSKICTNVLVKNSDGCFDLVEDALRFIDSKVFCIPSYVTPRRSLETPVIVVDSNQPFGLLQCYCPCADRWYRLNNQPTHTVARHFNCRHDLVPFCGKLYVYNIPRSWGESLETSHSRLFTYDPYSNSWMSLSYPERRVLKQVFVRNEREMYALLSEPCAKCQRLCQLGSRLPKAERCNREKHLSFITKYKPESNSWEDLSSFEHMNITRRDVCIVPKDNGIYFIGGAELVTCSQLLRHGEATKDNLIQLIGGARKQRGIYCNYLTDVDRYDLSKNQWDKVAKIQMARRSASGAVANGKLFVAGGLAKPLLPGAVQCEVFSETTNEWQFIKINMPVTDEFKFKLLSIDDKVYLLSQFHNNRNKSFEITVECYDPDRKKWNQKTKVPSATMNVHCCSMRIFKGFLNELQTVNYTPLS